MHSAPAEVWNTRPAPEGCSLVTGIAFAATAGPRGGREQCAEVCMNSNFSCVVNGVGTKQQCYMHTVNRVRRCGLG